jgi:hypothetical protein
MHGRAVEPLRNCLTEGQYQRLIPSLAVVIGWEAMAVLPDIRPLDDQHERAVMCWTARTLVEAMISEANAPETPHSGLVENGSVRGASAP